MPDLDPAVVEALVIAEVGQPTRDRLAGLPGMSASLVDRVARRCEGKLVRALEAAAEAAVARRARAPRPAASPPDPVAAAPAMTAEQRADGLAAMRQAMHGARRFTV